MNQEQQPRDSHLGTLAEARSEEVGAAAVALQQLVAEHPHMEFWTDVGWAGARIWYARGRDGHPWLVMSDDLDRFRAAITEPI
jgi:hypothetical protein